MAVGRIIDWFALLITYPVWWLILKSPEQGAQSYLLASMEETYGRGEGGKLIKECRELEPLRPEVKSEEVAKKLWEFSEKQIEQLEKEGAVRRALAKKEAETEIKAAEKKEKLKEKHACKPAVAAANGSASGTEQRQTQGSRRSKKAK
jgi:hypothetical protein